MNFIKLQTFERQRPTINLDIWIRATDISYIQAMEYWDPVSRDVMKYTSVYLNNRDIINVLTTVDEILKCV